MAEKRILQKYKNVPEMQTVASYRIVSHHVLIPCLLISGDLKMLSRKRKHGSPDVERYVMSFC